MTTMKNKAVSFNLDNPKDLKRFEHVQDINFSQYVKAFIDEDIERKRHVIKVEVGKKR